MRSISIRHNFETAHRLPPMGGKCASLHGHSWWVSAYIEGDPDANGVIIDFTVIKRALREWIDTNLDHGSMLGQDDPLVSVLRAQGCKVFVFGYDRPAHGIAWPTVENVSLLLSRVCGNILGDAKVEQARVTRVDVYETHVNSASSALDTR